MGKDQRVFIEADDMAQILGITKGGPGSGQNAGHEFEGNQWTTENTGAVMGAVRTNGGATVSMDGKEPTDGYIVATDPKLGVVVNDEDFFDPAKCGAMLKSYIKKNQADFASGTKYMGLWHNAGKVHLDVVEKIDDEDAATKAGQDRNQKSIWDVKGAKEIQTGGAGSG